MPQQQSVSYLPGEDPGTVKANAEYQEALQKMLASLDARRNRMFDPQLLALAQGFLKPTQTGSFGESLGYAAGSLREAQEKQALEDQKLAEARLGLAGKGLELERQRARERSFQQLARMGAPAAEEAPAAAPVAVPGGAPGQAPALVGAGQVAQGVAQAGAGRLAAPMPSLTRQQFMALQAGDGTISATQAESNWAEYQKRMAETERGRAEAERARSDTVERQVYGSTFRVPIPIALQLDYAQVMGDTARYKAVADQFMRGVGQPPRSVAEAEIQKAGEMEREKVLQTESAKLEAKVPEMLDTAMQIRSISDRIMRDVSMFPQAFGVFEKPGVMAAFATLIDEGLSLGTTRVNMAGFRRAVTQADPSMSQPAIDALLRFAGNKAELELLFRRKYLSGQGQGSISNMETAIIPSMIGSEKDSPQSLQDKVRLLSLRAQFDIKEAQKWNEMSEANPKLTYLQFRRSQEWKKMRDEYDQVLRRDFLHLVPRSDGAAPARPSGVSPAVVPPATPPARPAVTTPVPATSLGAPQLTAPTRPAAPARPAQAQPMPGDAPFSNAVRRIESIAPTR